MSSEGGGGGGGGGEVKVLGVWSSPFVLRVLMALNHRGLPYHYQEEGDLSQGDRAKSPLLLASNPVHKKVPVLLHRGRPVCESLIILQYIDDTWPSPHSLLPEDPYARALARFWADFVDKKFFDPHLLWSDDPLVQEQAQTDIKESYMILEKAWHDLVGDKPYFGGDCIGLIDIVLASYIPWLKAYEILDSFKLLDQELFPCLHAWIERVTMLPSIREILIPRLHERLVDLVQSRRRAFGLKV